MWVLSVYFNLVMLLWNSVVVSMNGQVMQFFLHGLFPSGRGVGLGLEVRVALTKWSLRFLGLLLSCQCFFLFELG